MAMTPDNTERCYGRRHFSGCERYRSILEGKKGPIEHVDGPFKQALDRTKYETRYPGTDPNAERDKASVFLSNLNDQIDD